MAIYEVYHAKISSTNKNSNSKNNSKGKNTSFAVAESAKTLSKTTKETVSIYEKNKYNYTVFLIDTKSKRAMSYNEDSHSAFPKFLNPNIPLNQVNDKKTLDALLNEVTGKKSKDTLFITGSQITPEAFSIFYKSCSDYSYGIQKIGGLLVEHIVVLKKAIYDKENGGH